jgi:DNA-binding protein H-NS
MTFDGISPAQMQGACSPSPSKMTKTYAQVMKQIDNLKAEAERLRRQEVDGVIERIREAIRHYGLTATDLGLLGGKTAARPAAKKTRGRRKAKAATTRIAKFRDDQGRTWVGRGKRPQWLRDALAAGKKLEDFAVN